MGNLIAILAHCRERGSEVILGAESHTFFYEVGNAAAVGGVSYHTIQEDANGWIWPAQVEAASVSCVGLHSFGAHLYLTIPPLRVESERRMFTSQ